MQNLIVGTDLAALRLMVEMKESKVLSLEQQMQKKRERDEIPRQKVGRKSFNGDLAEQIYQRYLKMDWDYTTPKGSVISGVVFDECGSHQEELAYSDLGRQDLKVHELMNLTEDTLVRPKLPGKQFTQSQVYALGRRTCYSLVERVGNTFFGIDSTKKCQCCPYNEFVKLRQLNLQDWHEGIMVKIAEEEKRVKRHPTIDRMYNGSVWEMEQVKGEWIPLRPRGINKKTQDEIVAAQQVTVPMLMSLLEKKDVSVQPRQLMSKAIVAVPGGQFLIKQNNAWDFVGGKAELNDRTPLLTLEREYFEETGLRMPKAQFFLKYETTSFQVSLYLIYDERLKPTNYALELLEGFPKMMWDYILKTDPVSVISYVSGTEYRPKSKKQLRRWKGSIDSPQKLIISDKKLPFGHEMCSPDGYFLYRFPECRGKEQRINDSVMSGNGIIETLVQELGWASAFKLLTTHGWLGTERGLGPITLSDPILLNLVENKCRQESRSMKSFKEHRYKILPKGERRCSFSPNAQQGPVQQEDVYVLDIGEQVLDE